ncbi:MAG: carboxypeptidase-like regulatory domain-containing protein, partial [Terriglobales bacterium]
MTRFKASAKWFGVFALVLVFSALAMAQSLDGTLRGEVTDPSGAVVSGAKVTVTNNATGVSKSTTTSANGTYNFPNMLVGSYTVTVEGGGFKKYSREQVQVRSNQVVDVNAKMAVGSEGTTVEVTAGAEVIQTDHQLVNTFDATQIVNLPINSPAGVSGVLNLAILAPGTTTQGGGVLGQGGSIGGARPRMNNFTVDGLDDNRVDITGPQSNVIADSIAEFTLITNQFSAEQGHSAGGQFNIVTKSGTNNWHGTAGVVNNNRNYNAFDNVEKITQGCTPGPCTKQRSDFNQFSGTLGGPIVKNKVFIFGAYQRVFAGFEGGSAVLEGPTATGLANLKTLSENAAVTEILNQFPVAATSGRTINVTNTRTGVTLPVAVGDIGLSAPSFYNEHDYQLNGDIALERHQIRMRYLNNRQRSPNLSDPPVPQFSGSVTFDVHKAALTDVWTINSRLVNDFRLGYTRQINGFTVPATFANFPNVYVNELTNFQVGPEGNSPQGGGQNVYQIVEQMSYSAGGHTLKFGVEGRRWIAPGGFLPRERGEWQYESLQNLVNDLVPVDFAKRGAGSGQTDGNQTAFFGF